MFQAKLVRGFRYNKHLTFLQNHICQRRQVSAKIDNGQTPLKVMTQFTSIDKNIYISCSVGSKVQIFRNWNKLRHVELIIKSMFDNILESLKELEYYAFCSQLYNADD